MNPTRRDEEYDAPLPEGARAAWTAMEPPDGFADRVLAARAPRRSRGIVVAAVVSLAAGVALTVAGQQALAPSRVAAGRWDGETQRELALGLRGTATASPHAQLSWTVDARGVAHVMQPRGRVFYRVERGEAFDVETPAGTVSVLGTCFVVDVSEEAVMRREMLGAATGAALAAAVVVTVYEGRVALANSHGRVEAVPGQEARARADAAPRAADSRAGRVARERDALAEERDRLRAQLDEAEAQVRSVMLAGRDAKDPLLAENQKLREQLAQAREALSAERADVAEREGRALPFPKELPESYRQDGLQRAFMDALSAAGIRGDVRSIDCTEFPCVVYGEAHHAADRAEAEADFKRFEAELRKAYPDKVNSMHEGVWSRSHKTDDGKAEHVSHFAISVYPSDAVDEATRNEVRKRMRHRNERYMETLE